MGPPAKATSEKEQLLAWFGIAATGRSITFEGATIPEYDVVDWAKCERAIAMAAAAQHPGPERSVVPRQVLVPLTKAAALVCVLLLDPGLALQAQGQPVELFACEPWCREARGGRLLDCFNPGPALQWTEIVGRAWWGPLTWQGPIRISMQARPLPVERYR